MNALLDEIEEDHGTGAADNLLRRLSSLTRWYVAKHPSCPNDYMSPIVPGMRRGEYERRERTLTDVELRKLWLAAESNGTFGAFVRIALLTGQRRTKVADMKWEDLEGDIWHMSKEDREKGVGGDLRLPQAAMKAIEAQKKIGCNPCVFAASTGLGPIRGYSKLKKRFDASAGIDTQWGLHDLRRTARSLMPRAGVAPHIAERC